jgi:hypothetical protein
MRSVNWWRLGLSGLSNWQIKYLTQKRQESNVPS